MRPVVTVGIPTFNRAALLKDAISSVLTQTWQDFEIVVSDDCSTDQTAAVVRGFGDPRLRYHRTATNLRPPRNWNECARLAAGEFLAILPDDDFYLPTQLETLVTALQQNPAIGFAQSGYYSVDEAGRPIASQVAAPERVTLTGEAALLWQWENLACLPVCILGRRPAMQALGFWREDYWDDWAFFLRLAYRAGFTFVPQALAANRTHSFNLNRVLHTERRDAILDLLNQAADVFGTALPQTPALETLQARHRRELSQHCVLLTLGALRRGRLGEAGFHLARARRLNALAGLDLGWVALRIRLWRAAAQARAARRQAQSRPTLLTQRPAP
ncbi:MAG: glycosyltransferase family 2 protein [Anaerolineales bacterium]|nr:glycosyltransferase family 2 protein [Anaerolineales bacterium]